MGFFDRLFGESGAAVRPEPLPRAELSTPPPGFGWHHFPRARVAVLRPGAWHTHEVDSEGSFTGCVTKESIPERGSFLTGLTLQLLRGVQGRAGLPASVLAVSMYQHAANDRFNTILLAEEGRPQGEAATHRFRHRNAPGVAEPIIIHSFYVALDRKEELYLFTFESPERVSAESWAVGEVILKRLVLDVRNP